MGDDDVFRVLTFVMAETLEAARPVVEALTHVAKTDMAAYWRPEPAFFDLLRDKRVINATLADIAGPGKAERMVTATATAKDQKIAIGDKIIGAGGTPDPDWRPRWMHNAPNRYLDGAASPPADHWAKVKSLFAAKEEPDKGAA